MSENFNHIDEFKEYLNSIYYQGAAETLALENPDLFRFEYEQFLEAYYE